MSLQPGTRVGPYEVSGSLGAGGMGEVYRAHDARLGRDVAIKVLPASFAADAERLHRFELEAKAVGQLNHPNVLTVYDVGTHDHAPYLVTELLEGESLRDRLSGESADRPAPLSVRRALDIGRQIALGLAAAHGANIVHRDLKPENVFITRDGRVKILDFGLARMAERDGGASSTTMQVTNPGTVLGTIGYMSPEQVRGKQADARSDLFAFGAILFEMVGGRRAFHRESSADTMAAILKEDPPELTASGLQVPAGVERLIRRCLEKNPDERFQSARDLAFAIEALDGSSAASTVAERPPAETHMSRRRLGGLVSIVAVLGAAAAGFLVGRGGWASAAAPAPKFELRQLTFGADALGMPALSPDAASFLFVDDPAGHQDIFVQRVGGENATNLTKDSAGADYQPAFSPDGRQIAFRSDRPDLTGGLFVMGATGESRRRLTDGGFNPAWSPDGKDLAYSTESIISPLGRPGIGSLWRVNLANGAKTKVYDGDGVQPSWSPDGKLLAFWGLPAGTGRRTVFTIPAAGGRPNILVDDAAMNWNPVWSRDGRFVYFLSDREPPMNIWRLPVDPATGAKRGEPERVTLGTANHSWLSPPANATFAFEASHTTSTVERVELSLTTGKIGPPQRVMRSARDITTGAVSPDGRLLSMTVTDTSEDLVVVGADGTGSVRLTTDAFRDRAATWSADSQMLYFMSNRSGQYEIWRIRLDGSQLEQLTRQTGNVPVGAPAVSRDGRNLSLLMFGAVLKTAIVDLTLPIDKRVPLELVPPRVPVSFRPLGWLVDGRLVGTTTTGRSKTARIVLYRPEDGKSSVIDTPGLDAMFIAGDRFVVAIGAGHRLHIVDLSTGAIRPGDVLPSGADTFVSPGGTSIYLVRYETVSNIWTLRH